MSSFQNLKWTLLQVSLGVLALGLFPQHVTAQEAPTKPNIVVFLVDDMGVMDTSLPFLTDAAGQAQRHPLNEYYRTPNMERLAAQGIRFNQFCAMSVCSPTRVSILKGQNAARHRATNWINGGGNNRTPHGPPEWNWHGIKAGDITLPAELKKNGYRTIHVGKAHFGPNDDANPLKIGFDINVAGGPMGHPASYYSEEHYGFKPKGKNKKISPNAVPNLEKYYDTGTFLTEALTLEANSHLTKAVEDKQPFFLYFGQYAVHSPFQSDPRFAANYSEDEKHPNAGKFATLIEGMDKSLGDVLDHLQAIGAAENTLILFLGDNGSDAPRGDEHGISSSAPLRGKKGTHYEGGMRVPFIAAWAQRNENSSFQKQLPIPAGAIQTQLATVCDIFPSVLDVCKITSPAGHKVDGVSFNKLLTGSKDENRAETFLMHYPHKHRTPYFTSYRDGDWKVIYHYLPGELSAGKHYQLFNLKSDPYEQQDLTASNPKELRSMMQKLVRSLEDHDALYPVDGEKVLKPLIP